MKMREGRPGSCLPVDEDRVAAPDPAMPSTCNISMLDSYFREQLEAAKDDADVLALIRLQASLRCAGIIPDE